MPGLPGEKGESGHVGLMVSKYHDFISSHFSQNLLYTWNGCNIPHLLYLILGTPWTARSHWSPRTNRRTGQIHIDLVICLDLFEVLFGKKKLSLSCLLCCCAGSKWSPWDDRTARWCWREGKLLQF